MLNVGKWHVCVTLEEAKASLLSGSLPDQRPTYQAPLCKYWLVYKVNKCRTLHTVLQKKKKKNNSNFQSFGELFIYWWCALLNAGHSMQCNFGSVSTVKLAIHPFFNTCLFPLSGLRGVSSSLSQLSVYLKTKLYYLSAMNLRMKCTVDLSLSICRSNHASWLPSWL